MRRIMHSPNPEGQRSLLFSRAAYLLTKRVNRIASCSPCFTLLLLPRCASALVVCTLAGRSAFAKQGSKLCLSVCPSSASDESHFIACRLRPEHALHVAAFAVCTLPSSLLPVHSCPARLVWLGAAVAC